MSKEAKKNAPVAVEPKASKQQTALPTEANAVRSQIHSPDAGNQSRANSKQFISIVDLLKDVSPDKLQMAESIGIPLRALISYFYQQEQIVSAIAKELPGLPDKFIGKLQEMANSQSSQPSVGQPGALQVPSPSPAGAPGILNSVGQFLPMIMQALSGSQQANPLQDQLMNMAMESLGLGNALTKALIMKMVPELATQILPPVVKKP